MGGVPGDVAKNARFCESSAARVVVTERARGRILHNISTRMFLGESCGADEGVIGHSGNANAQSC